MIPKDTPFFMPCCGVVSVATLAEQPYRVVHDYIKDRGRKPNHWKGRTSSVERRYALIKFGVEFETKYYKPRYITFRRWLYDVYDPAHDYEVTVTGHSVAIKDGKLFDQHYRYGVHPLATIYLRKYVRVHNKVIE